MDALEAALLAALDQWAGVPDILSAYAARCDTVGRAVRVAAPAETFDGMAVGLSGDGALEVQTADGAVRRVLAGDVSVRTEGISGEIPFMT